MNESVCGCALLREREIQSTMQSHKECEVYSVGAVVCVSSAKWRPVMSLEVVPRPTLMARGYKAEQQRELSSRNATRD